jgi:hypothetical protein
MRARAVLVLPSIALTAAVVGCPNVPPPEAELVVTRYPADHEGEVDLLEIREPALAPEAAFTVERSCDGTTYEPIGTIDAASPFLVAVAPSRIVSDPTARELFDQLAAVDVSIAELGETGTCRADPTCAAALAPLEDDATRLLGEIDAAIGSTPEDPQDLGAAGDPSADVRHVHAMRLSSGLAIHLRAHGAWPPADAIYSWYFAIELLDGPGGSRLARITVQRHAGERAVIVEGIAASDVVVEEGPDGLVVRVLAPPAGSTHVAVESGAMTTPSSGRVTERAPDAGAYEIVDLDPDVEHEHEHCLYRGIDADGGLVLFQEAAATRPRYENWDEVVPAGSDDPCAGKTPLQCFAERHAEHVRRVCDGGELDSLPQPRRDACRALMQMWATFAPASCDPIRGGRAAASTTPAGAGTPPPAAPGADPNGRTSTIRFDVFHMVQSPCAYGIFLHELLHAHQYATRPADPDLEQRERDLAAAKARVAAALEARQRAGAGEAERTELANATAAERQARAQRDAIRTPAVFADECGAYSSVLELWEDVTAGATEGDRLRWMKLEIANFYEQLSDVIRDDRPPPGTDLTAACACIEAYRARAMSIHVSEDDPSSPTIWQCAGDRIASPHRPEDRHADLRALLGCR